MASSVLSAPPATGPSAGRDERRQLWRRWLAASFLGEALGFLVPVLAVVLGAEQLSDGPRLVAFVVAGAGEGVVLGLAQSRVLVRALPRFPQRAWIARTGLAAALAGARQEWSGGLQIVLAVPAGLALLLSIGTAQWTVLRPVVRGAARWIVWTALAWLAGLGVFMAVATPLWQPGQATWLSALIGAGAGALTALTMAAVSGWGLLRLLPAAAHPAGLRGSHHPAAWTLPSAEVAAGFDVDPATGLDDAA